MDLFMAGRDQPAADQLNNLDEGPPKKTEPTVICNLLHVDGALAVIHHVFFMPLLLVLALVVLRRNGAAADKVQSARIVTIVTIVFAFVDLLVAGQG